MPTKRKNVKRQRIERDDLQWRVANTLLVVVIGLMFFGYGIAQAGGQNATAYQVVGGGVETGTMASGLPTAYMFAGVFLVTFALSALVLYKRNLKSG